MNEYAIISLFCEIDDYCKREFPQEDSRREVSDSEVILTAIIAAYQFGGNLRKAIEFVIECDYCPKMITESRFNRRLHAIPEDRWEPILRDLSRGKDSDEYLIDSFPVPTCRMVRRNRCKLFAGGCFLGYSSSHKQYFFGAKVHLITTANGRPIQRVISPASEHADKEVSSDLITIRIEKNNFI